MNLCIKKQQEKTTIDAAAAPKPPELARRRQNRQSAIKSGRTIGEKREKLETKNERNIARKKDKRKKAFRIIFTVIGFIIMAFILVALYLSFFSNGDPIIQEENIEVTNPTIEIIDEDSASGGQITARMNSYIAHIEKDLRDLGYTPVKAVIPSGTIREVDIYLDDYSGFIKTTIDRGSAVSAEDADRMLRYLSSIEVGDFSYIDVRIDGKAYWK